MNTLVISPENSVIDEIIPHLKISGMDYSYNMVVFPGKRPSHFLRKEIAGRIGKSFIPPLILSMDEFVDYVFEGIRSGKKLETIDAIYILYEIHKSIPLPPGGQRFITPDEFFPIGLKIYKDVEELYIEKVTVNQLKNVEFYTTEIIPANSLNRLQSLSYFYEGFYRRIEELGFSTRASRYRIVSDEIEEAILDKFQKIIFAGFFALTGSEKRLFKKLSSLDNTFFIFQEGTGLKDKLKDLGITANNKETGNNYPETFFYSSPDTHGEVYAAGNILKDKPLDTKTVVVLPSSETLFPLIRQGLTFVDEDDYNISLGYPLYRTPIFGFMNNLMDLITSMDGELIYIPYYLRFMLHPYTKNIYFRGNAEITRIILHAMEDELTKKRTRTFLTLSEVEEDISHLMDKISDYGIRINVKDIKEHLSIIHQNTIGKFVSFKDIRDFAMKCKEVLTYIYNNSTARLHPLFYPFSEAFIKQMDVLAQSLMKEVCFEKVPAYFAFFRKYIMNLRLPFEGTPLKGLQILGFLETRNIKFDRIFFLDANEEVIPDTKKEDSLLPLKVKEMLGIPAYTDRDKLMAYYFDTLLKGAKEVHLFFIENDKKERSRFVERLLWERQKKDIKTDSKDYIQQVKYRVSLVNKIPEEIEKTDNAIRFLREFSYNPSALDDYLKCRLKFYYTHVLKLEKKDEVTGDIERSDIGEIVHDALKRYFSKRTGHILKEKDIDLHEMDNLVNEIFEKEYGRNITGAIYLLRRQIKNRLREFLERYYMPLIKNEVVSISNVEKKIILKMDAFKLKGRIDSIEKRGNKIFILDYKTSSSKDKLKIRLDRLDLDDRDTWSNAIGSLQMPFYLMLFLEKGKKIKHLSGVYLLLGRSMMGRDIEIPPFEESETERAMDMLRKIIISLLKEIVDPSMPFAPAKDIKNVCPLCNFRYICGTQWVRR
ncbi:MAG: PD-(D/E)XK nuclease family protein [Nitrospirae bacterium]|nr:PD-(D/E)XK nuclease family protein [Nitrospirota bacterium]